MPEKRVSFQVPSFGSVVQAAFWVLVFGFILSLSALVLSWPQAVARSLLAVGCHLINFYFFYSYLIPRHFEKGKYLYSIAGALLLLCSITPLRMVLEGFFNIDEPAIALRVGSDARAGFILFSEITIAGFASLLRLAVSSDQIKLRLKDMEKYQLETELRFLKAQMSPHFLFNSINNIYSLVLLKSDSAPHALMKLSALLRYLLYECDHPVSIAKETEALKTYPDLFQLRFEEPIRLTWTIQVADPGRTIEPLILMPLLENALKHSGIGTVPGAEVHLTLFADHHILRFQSENTISTDKADDSSGGIGLTNIQKRLSRLYPEKHTLTISATEKWFSLSLEMPLL